MRALRKVGIAVATALALTGDVAFAQGTGCTLTSTGLPHGVCQKARDFFEFIAPQVGVALAGGNPIAGEGGSLGGTNWRSGSFRVYVLEGRAPANSVPLNAGNTGVASDFGSKKLNFVVSSVDLAQGLIGGRPMGVTNVGGVDLLLGVMFVPNVNSAPVEVDPAGSGFIMTYGLRIGALQETSIIPGLAISWTRRRLGSFSASYASTDDTIRVRNGESTVNSFKLTASKRYSIFGIAAGVGQDRIRTIGGIDAIVNEGSGSGSTRVLTPPALVLQKVDRTSAFLNFTVGRPRVRGVAEIGWSLAGDDRATVNTFGGDRANGAYRYGSLGVNFRF